MRAAIYLRMSTDKQEDSPARQLGQIQPYAEKNGYRVVGEPYVDEGERGWKECRAGFQRLLRDAQTGKFQYILVDEVSRLTRFEPLDFLVKVAYPLREAGVQLVSVAEGPQEWDNLVGLILALVSQDKAAGESRAIARRVVTQYERVLREGGEVVRGNPPYGYRRVWLDSEGRVVHEGTHPPEAVRRTKPTPRLVPGPDHEVRAVQFIFDAYVNRDLSLRDICRELNRRGVPSPAGKSYWSRPAVRQLILNPAYAGIYAFNRHRGGKYFRLTREGIVKADGKRMRFNPKSEWVLRENCHEPLVPVEVYKAAQLRLEANRRRTTPAAHRGLFLLSGLLRCPSGGLPMHAVRCPSGVYYRCSNGRSEDLGLSPCRGNTVKECEAVAGILAALRSRFLNPDVLGRLRARIRQMEERARSDDHVASLRRELKALGEQIERAARRMATVEDEEVALLIGTEIRSLKTRREEVEALLKESGQPRYIETLEALVRQTEELLWRLEEAASSADPDELRGYLKRVVAWVEVDVEAVRRGQRLQYRLRGGTVYLKARA